MNVLARNGYEAVSGIRKTYHDSYYKLTFVTGEIIECTIDHIFESIDGPITAKYLTKYQELYHVDNGTTFLKSKCLIKKKFESYDLIDVENGSLYYTNSILSHNCSFLGSSNTLINISKIQQLVFLDPIVEQKYLKIYEQPVKNKIYIALVDVAAGLGQDYSIVNIIDVTTSPYKQVLVYRNNEIDPSSFSIVVENLAKKYNMAYLIIESNNDGKIVSKELWDSEYENLISTRSDLGDNMIKTGKRSQPGIMMTKQTKKNGCSKLKDLIENNVLNIIDSDTIQELSNFIQLKGSYGADTGKHDDIVMTLVMFAWFATTVYFEDVTGNNVNREIKENRVDDELYSLLGFVGGDDNEELPVFNTTQVNSSFNFW